MPAFVCSDRHIATVAIAYTQILQQPWLAQATADALLALNLAAAEPNPEKARFRTCYLGMHNADRLRNADLWSLTRIVEIQCAGLPGWDQSNGRRLLELIAATFEVQVALRGEPLTSAIKEL